MYLDVIELLVELVLLVMGILLNGVLAFVSLGRSRSDADRDVILTMSVLDLVSGISQCGLNMVSLLYSLFGVSIQRSQALGLALQTHASMVLLPATLIGLVLATLLGMARCAVIVFGFQTTYVGTAAIFTSTLVMCLHTASFLTMPTFYGVIFHLDLRNPKKNALDWYTLVCLGIFSVCLFAITLSYALLTRHYYQRKRLCDLRGKPLRAPIRSLAIITIMYSVAILPRILATVLTQILCKDLLWDSHFVALSPLIFLPIINAAFSLFLHDESRCRARRIFKTSS